MRYIFSGETKIAKHLHPKNKWKGALFRKASLMRKLSRTRPGNPLPTSLCFSLAQDKTLLIPRKKYIYSSVLPLVM